MGNKNFITGLKIQAKKNALSKGDYKVIKCMEAQLSGAEMPYDVNDLVAERNAIRAEINALEKEF